MVQGIRFTTILSFPEILQFVAFRIDYVVY